jgi:DivIVA domain-containing protein
MDDSTYDPQAGTRFPTTRWREGYDVASVDAFVARAERAVSMRDGSVTAREVEQVRFAPVRLRTGYQMDDVDNHLARLAQDLQAIEGARG